MLVVHESRRHRATLEFHIHQERRLFVAESSAPREVVASAGVSGVSRGSGRQVVGPQVGEFISFCGGEAIMGAIVPPQIWSEVLE